MIKSMTAFARGGFTSNQQRYLIEIQSVNRKTLEMNFHMPREFLFAEIPLKKIISKKVGRGQVTVRIAKELSEGQSLPNLPNNEQLNEIKGYVEEAARSLGMTPSISLPLLFDLSERVGQTELLGNEEVFLQELTRGCEACVAQLFEMKLREGAELKKDFLLHIDQIPKIVAEIEGEAGDAKMRFVKRLEERLKEMGPIEEVEGDRIAREVALLGERIDITEEVTRLKSHCLQFKELIESDEERLGRTLDFLLQEMNREINTIASKSQELSISQKVVIIKTELDRLREQIQNIE